MTYSPNIPQAADNLSTSQGQMLTNFGQANTLFGLDHYPFDDSTSALRGHHKKVEFSAPIANPTVSGVIGALYTKADTNDTNNRSQLFYRNITAVQQVTNRFYDPSLVDGYLMMPGGTPANPSLIFLWTQQSVDMGSLGHTVTLLFPAIANYSYIGPQTAGFPNNCIKIFFQVVSGSTSKNIFVYQDSVTPPTKENYTIRLHVDSFPNDIVTFNVLAIGN